MKKYLFLLLLIFLQSFNSFAQSKPEKQLNPAEIKLALKKMQVLGSVLYVAAHPDDENTRLLGYFANEGYRTGYLSITRGDGGQNLIGKEVREQLGIIRTQELLAARRTDGAEQFFTRANDFGFSKTSTETLQVWDSVQVLADVVWAIRKFRPDIMITRFPKTSEAGHGHHSSSAILAEVAFGIAGDKNVFPEQLQFVEVWQPKRIFWNNWRPLRPTFAPNDPKKTMEELTKGLIPIDLGKFNVLLGKDYGEIAAESRSQHKSQGFGVATVRGQRMEYLEDLTPNPFMEINKVTQPKSQLIPIDEKGIPTTLPKLTEEVKPLTGKMISVEPLKLNHPFDYLNTSWVRNIKGKKYASEWCPLENGKKIDKTLANILDDFEIENPENSVPLLLELYAEMQKLPVSHWKTQKIKELQSIILNCAGVWSEAFAKNYSTVAGDSLEITTNIIKRSNSVKVVVYQMQLIGEGRYHDDVMLPIPMILSGKPIAIDLKENVLQENKGKFLISKLVPISQPYWLIEPEKKGMFTVNNLQVIGEPENTPRLKMAFSIKINDVDFTIFQPVLHKWTDEIDGEKYRRLEITPPATVNFAQSAYVVNNGKPEKIAVTVQAQKANIKGKLRLVFDNQALTSSNEFDIDLKTKDKIQTFEFEVSPKTVAADFSPQSVNVKAVLTIDSVEYDNSLVRIDYKHIPIQTLFPKATAKVLLMNVQTKVKKVGYIEGAGDAIPDALKELGCEVHNITESWFVENLLQDEKTKPEVIVFGIRAYNTNDLLKKYQDKILKYVEDGGTVIVQYNTANQLTELVTPNFAPFPITLSRDRVTEEDAEMRMLKPEHSIFNSPNKITQEDFKGWVQERGLYFPNKWDANYEALLSCNDKGEPAKDGSLLVAKYGKGYYVYTGLSFFRELPAGVIGAYRLFANLVSVGK
jgi:LmbE family N-acetylglucosaminyl deacetylase